MNKRVILYLSVVVTSLLLALADVNYSVAESTSSNLIELCNSFNAVNNAIRDNTINRTQAKDQVKKLIDQIKKEYYASGGQKYGMAEWVFPLRGYGYKAIGGVHGNCYQRGGYNYFDGNRHSGHPSLDIFIHDKRQASLDDATQKPVSVLSVSGGIVVSLEKTWETTSFLRGGKYLWIYDPATDALFYYAHNSKLLVEVGDKVKPGDIIAEVGRTGFNAYKKRSPTHLHITYLKFINGLPTPKNIYKELISSKLL